MDAASAHVEADVASCGTMRTCSMKPRAHTRVYVQYFSVVRVCGIRQLSSDIFFLGPFLTAPF